MLLQGEETFEVIPNSHFTVSRTAHRNNSSDYYINEKKSNFTDVTKMLKSKGIDLDNNRFLILQVSCNVCTSQAGCDWQCMKTKSLRIVVELPAQGMPSWMVSQVGKTITVPGAVLSPAAPTQDCGASRYIMHALCTYSRGSHAPCLHPLVFMSQTNA